MTTRVLIAEDMAAYRETLVATLDLEDDIEVVAQLATGDRVLPAVLEHRPDVALLDIDLPGIDGLTVTTELCARHPTCRVLILTGLAHATHLARALAAGAAGFLAKDRPADDLIDAVRRVARGERVFPEHP